MTKTVPASAQAADLHYKKEDMGALVGVPYFCYIEMYIKTATTIDEQIDKLKKRGMNISTTPAKLLPDRDCNNR